MKKLDKFMNMLCGTFDNREQCLKEESMGMLIHPVAKHVIGICNDRISNLPTDFKGYFVIEESYFDINGKLIDKHYLFLYEENPNGDILLTSYNLPKDIPKESFTNSNKSINFDYNELVISPRFKPLILKEENGEFFGENISRFSEDTIFKFRLNVKSTHMLVKELLLRDDKIVAGYEDAIIYVKTNDIE